MLTRWCLSGLSVFVAIALAWPHVGLAQEAGPSVRYPSVKQGYPTTQSLYGVSITTPQAARIRALDSNLGALGARSGGRILDGSLTIGLGATFVTIGVLVRDPLVRVLLCTTGSLSMARGVVQLTVLPDAEEASIAFAHMPMLSASQVIARIAYGEEALARLARRSRAARLIDGTLTMFAGLTYVPAYMFARHRRDDSFRYGDDGIDYVVAAFGGISFVGGLVTMLVKSDAEQRYKAYAELSQRLQTAQSSKQAFRLPQIAPYASRDGAGVAAVMRF